MGRIATPAEAMPSRPLRFFACIVLAAMMGCGCASLAPEPAEDGARALAPEGRLRVAFLAGPLYATRDPASGEWKGVAVDLGRELARRAGVPFEPAALPNPGAVVQAAASGQCDVALMGINAERAAVVDFSAPYMEVEQGVLVRPGVAALAIADLDRPGVRIGVIEKSAADLHLSGTMRSATLRRANLGDLLSQLANGQLEAVAATKAALYAAAAKQPGSRVLDERLLVEPIGMGVPKGRGAAAAQFVGKFVEEAKAEGLVKSAIERAGLRGVAVATTK